MYEHIYDAFPQKQGTSDILGKMSFTCHCKEYTFSFNLIPKSSSYSYFLRYDYYVYKTVRGFSGSVILRNWSLKFPVPKVFNLTGCHANSNCPYRPVQLVLFCWSASHNV